MSAPIAIKGNKDGLRLMLSEDAPWDQVLAALQSQLERGTEFFHGAELTVDTGERALHDDELNALLTLMREHGLHPSALATSSREGRNAGRAIGIATRPAIRPAAAPARDTETDGALLVMRTLRSGQVLRHHGHVTIIGDVNPGAELIAGGSAIVWGRLRGTVHAGALGDSSAVVCALELMPSLLRIADLMSRTPDQRPTGPEMARIDDGQIVVEQWEGSRRGTGG
jgi:septum site-determining protein MinC